MPDLVLISFQKKSKTFAEFRTHLVVLSSYNYYSNKKWKLA